MPRPEVKSVRIQSTLSETQMRQVDRVASALGFSTTGETLRYLITRGLQSEVVTTGAGANQEMATAFREMVNLMAQGAEMERTEKGGNRAES